MIPLVIKALDDRLSFFGKWKLVVAVCPFLNLDSCFIEFYSTGDDPVLDGTIGMEIDRDNCVVRFVSDLDIAVFRRPLLFFFVEGNLLAVGGGGVNGLVNNNIEKVTTCDG